MGRLRGFFPYLALFLIPLFAIAEDAPKFPKVGSGTVLISSTNASEYRAVVPQELMPLVKGGLVPLTCAEEDSGTFKIQNAFAKKTPLAEDSAISSTGALRESIKLQPGLLFGGTESFEKEGPHFPHKILWNFHSVLWSQRVLSNSIELIRLREGKRLASLQGTYARVYPSMITASVSSDQLFREKLMFTQPAVVSPYSWLTFRFLGNDEDMVWVLSPVTKKNRQLTGSNRSDPLAGSTVSSEDFYTWSGKPELVDAALLGTATLLAPFADLKPASAAAQGELCHTIQSGLSLEGIFNFENHLFPQALSWIPSTATFIPRKMWRLQLGNRDPYSLYGQQILYIDRDLMLPVYKFSYDRNGNLWKIVITAWGMASTGEGGRQFPFAAYTIAEDRLTKEASILIYRDPLICDGFTESIKLADFDPRRLGGTPSEIVNTKPN